LASDFFSFMIILQTIGLLGRVISPSQGLYLNKGQHKHRLNTYTYQISTPCVGFEPTISASERRKTVHALDQCFSTAGPRPGTGSWHRFYRALVLYKNNLPGRCVTQVENHCPRPLGCRDRHEMPLHG
jgi:hypothetical protein